MRSGLVALARFEAGDRRRDWRGSLPCAGGHVGGRGCAWGRGPRFGWLGRWLGRGSGGRLRPAQRISPRVTKRLALRLAGAASKRERACRRGPRAVGRASRRRAPCWRVPGGATAWERPGRDDGGVRATADGHRPGNGPAPHGRWLCTRRAGARHGATHRSAGARCRWAIRRCPRRPRAGAGDGGARRNGVARCLQAARRHPRGPRARGRHRRRSAPASLQRRPGGWRTRIGGGKRTCVRKGSWVFGRTWAPATELARPKGTWRGGCVAGMSRGVPGRDGGGDVA